MKIKYLDICYRIIGDLQQDRKEILMYDYQKHISKEIPAVDDLRDLEMYEILRMPVISLPIKKESTVKEGVTMRLEILCYSNLPDCTFIYLFSGDKWNYYFFLK